MKFTRASVSLALLLMPCMGPFGASGVRAAVVGRMLGVASSPLGASRFSINLAPLLASSTAPSEAITNGAEDFTIEEATDPFLLAWSVALQPSYFQFRQGRGSRGYVRIKSVAEYDFGFGLPLWTRLQWPVFEADNTTGPLKAGVGDLNLLLLGILHDGAPWGRFGVGPVFVFPAASHHEMGRQSYQVGPAFGWSDRLIRGWGFAFLGQQFLSYAGQQGRTGVNRFLMQPFIIKYLSHAWYVETQPVITVNFENDTSVVPLNFTVGRLVSRKVNINVQTDVYPDWTNTPKYNWDVRMSISYLFRSPL